MKLVWLPLLLASATALADGSTVTLSYDAKVNPKLEAPMKAEAAKHASALDKAAAGKKYEVKIQLKSVDTKGDDIKCAVMVHLSTPTAMFAMLNSGASTNGKDHAAAAADCVQAVVGELLDKQVAPALEKKSKS